MSNKYSGETMVDIISDISGKDKLEILDLIREDAKENPEDYDLWIRAIEDGYIKGFFNE